jgi:hypothetical protein
MNEKAGFQERLKEYWRVNMKVHMRKIYQLLIIILATQFAGIVYGMEGNVGDSQSPHDAEMINKLEQIGQVVQRYSYPTDEAYFLIRRDAVEVAPGKEHFNALESLLRGLHLFAIGALLPSVATVMILVKLLVSSEEGSGINSFMSRQLGGSLLVAIGLLASNVLTMYTVPSLVDECANQWQIMPKCLDIDARKVIKKQFWHLYPEGAKLECKVENSWSQHIGYAIALMSGLSLGIWGYWKMGFRSKTLLVN